MSTQSKAIARRIIKEIWNKGRLDLVDELYAKTFSYTSAVEQAQGPDGYKALVEKYRTAFPDLETTIDELIVEGNRVVTRWTARGTHRGNLPDLPATGKRVTMSGITVVRLQRGKVVNETTAEDNLGMLQQLGVIPELGQAKPQAKAATVAAAS